MADYSKTRSEYMRIMMGDNPSAPYKPDNINDVGDTSFDVASLSNDEINTKLDGMKNTSETETQSAEKPWYEAIGDFFSNIGTSITEGVFNVIDNVYDFGLSIVGGIGGGWFGQNKDFTDKIADLMTDNRWVMYATDLLTSKAVANPLEMATNIANSGIFHRWRFRRCSNRCAGRFRLCPWLWRLRFKGFERGSDIPTGFWLWCFKWHGRGGFLSRKRGRRRYACL